MVMSTVESEFFFSGGVLVLCECCLFVFSGEHHGTVGRRARLPTEPGPEAMAGYNSPILTSPIKSPPYNSTGTDSDDNSCKCKL